jgi:hypothetical protein
MLSNRLQASNVYQIGPQNTHQQSKSWESTIDSAFASKKHEPDVLFQNELQVIMCQNPFRSVPDRAPSAHADLSWIPVRRTKCAPNINIGGWQIDFMWHIVAILAPRTVIPFNRKAPSAVIRNGFETEAIRGTNVGPSVFDGTLKK